MDLLANLALGFGVALTPVNLLYALIGVVLGTLIGVLISVTTIPAVGNLGVAMAYGNGDEAWGSLIQLGANVGVLIVAGLLTLLVQRAAFARRVSTFVERLRDVHLLRRRRGRRG